MPKTEEELALEREKKEAERKKAEKDETPVVEQLLAGVRTLQATIEQTTKDNADRAAADAVKEAASRKKTPAQTRVDAAIELTDGDDKGGEAFELPAAYRMPQHVEARAYGSAGRTQPVALADYRYRTLPKWQEFRHPASDLLIASFMAAVRDNDRPTIHAMMEQDRKVRIAIGMRLPESMLRADMNIGDIAAAGGPYDGTVGQLVPLVLAQQLFAALYRTARMEPFSRVTFGPNVRHAKQNALSSSNWTGESLPITPGEPEADELLVLSLHDLTNRANLSNRTIRDAFGVVSWLLGDAASEMQERLDSTFYATGTGTLQPNSLELADTILTTSAPLGHVRLAEQTAGNDNDLPGSLTRVAMQAMLNLVHPKNRGKVMWTGNDTVMQAISNIVDGAGRSIFQNRNDPIGVLDGELDTGSTIDRAFNKPVVQMPGKEAADPEVPVDATENRLYCINMERAYAINRPVGGGDIEIAVTTQSDAAFDNNQTAYRFITSADGGRLGNSASTGVVDYAYTGAIKLTPA